MRHKRSFTARSLYYHYVSSGKEFLVLRLKRKKKNKTTKFLLKNIKVNSNKSFNKFYRREKNGNRYFIQKIEALPWI